MKKKLALITLHSVKNYGSALQTYATQEYFKRLGYEVEVIDYRRPWETPLGYWFAQTEKSAVGLLRNVLYFPSKIPQYFRFKRFMESKINLSENMYCSKEDFFVNPIEADVYCTGSDQVWNSGWNNGVIPAYFLDFVNKKGVKKISFAASFGSSELNDNDKNIIRPLLEKYDYITVRESGSVTMLKEVFNLNSTEILDPTLQMKGDFWKALCDKKRMIDEDYVLLIQLNRSSAFNKFSVEFAKDKNIKLVRLCLRVDQMFMPGKAIVIPEVQNYIRLIRDAKYVLTDSFHAVSFCLNLNKQFYVYYPPKYSERLKSILDITGLSNRVITKDLAFPDQNNVIDYTYINELLDKKRKDTKDIIESMIGDN